MRLIVSFLSVNQSVSLIRNVVMAGRWVRQTYCQQNLNLRRLSDFPNHQQQQATHPESRLVGMSFIWSSFDPSPILSYFFHPTSMMNLLFGWLTCWPTDLFCVLGWWFLWDWSKNLHLYGQSCWQREALVESSAMEYCGNSQRPNGLITSNPKVPS